MEIVSCQYIKMVSILFQQLQSIFLYRCALIYLISLPMIQCWAVSSPSWFKMKLPRASQPIFIFTRVISVTYIPRPQTVNRYAHLNSAAASSASTTCSSARTRPCPHLVPSGFFWGLTVHRVEQFPTAVSPLVPVFTLFLLSAAQHFPTVLLITSPSPLAGSQVCPYFPLQHLILVPYLPSQAKMGEICSYIFP